MINPSFEGNVLSFEVALPFWAETPQVRASTNTDYSDFLSRLPNYVQTHDYFIVGEYSDEVFAKQGLPKAAQESIQGKF